MIGRLRQAGLLVPELRFDLRNPSKRGTPYCCEVLAQSSKFRESIICVGTYSREVLMPAMCDGQLALPRRLRARDHEVASDRGDAGRTGLAGVGGVAGLDSYVCMTDQAAISERPIITLALVATS